MLLLQNAFLKGKYNASLSHNAQNMALFRCPADKRQIGLMADRLFDKNKPDFMEIYNSIMSKPYSYGIVSSKADRQVIAGVFGNSVSYNITGVDSTACHKTGNNNYQFKRKQRENLQNRPFQNIETK